MAAIKLSSTFQAFQVELLFLQEITSAAKQGVQNLIGC